MRQVGKIIGGVVNLLYPPVCPLCNTVLARKEGYLCRECRPKVSYLSSPVCFKCGKEVDDEEVELCVDCTTHVRSYIRGYPAINYDDLMRKSIGAFKYHNKREYASYFAYEIIRHRGRELADIEPDALIPIPIHKTKLKKRGYNQAEILAEKIGDYIRVPVDSEVIIRNTNTLPQKDLDSVERDKNLKSAFISSGKIVNYNKVVLVDDIYTTGATVEACTRVLHDIGVIDVYYTSICIGKGC